MFSEMIEEVPQRVDWDLWKTIDDALSSQSPPVQNGKFSAAWYGGSAESDDFDEVRRDAEGRRVLYEVILIRVTTKNSPGYALNCSFHATDQCYEVHLFVDAASRPQALAAAAVVRHEIERAEAARPSAPTPSRLRRFLSNGWVIGIGTGLVVALVVWLLTLAL